MDDKKLHVLIIEDRYEDRIVLQDLISQSELRNAEISWENSLLDPHVPLSLNACNIILLDIALSEFDGLASLKYLVSLNLDIPILILADNIDRNVAIDALKIGAQDYIYKSEINVNVLSKSIFYGLERHRFQRVLELKSKKLAERNSQFDKLMQMNMDGIVVFNSNKEVIFHNSIAKPWLKPSPLTKNKLIFPFDVKVGEEKIQTIEIEEYSKIILNIRTTSMIWKDEKCIFANLRNITSDSQLLEETVKSNKLESLGILAGGIAHDFNNILTAAIGNLNLAKYEDNIHSIQEHLDETERAILRAKGLTQQLLTFAKGGSPIKKAFSIAKLLRDSIKFILSGSKCSTVFNISSDLWAINADKSQISQVLQNLSLNAAQACPNGGQIRIRAENVVLPEISDMPCDAGPYVKISISDTGIGISEENLVKIFDPFFTTKKSGSGLGLSTCFSIIRKHNGHITVESKLNRGATFSIFLPAVLTKNQHTPNRQQSFNLRMGRVLIVDDELPIRSILSQMLGKLGYDVISAESGKQALDYYHKLDNPLNFFEFVITDLTIPGDIGGMKLAESLLKIDPTIKIIVSSGYSNDPVLSEYQNYGFVGCLKKPYTLENIIDLVGEIFDEVLPKQMILAPPETSP